MKADCRKAKYKPAARFVFIMGGAWRSYDRRMVFL